MQEVIEALALTCNNANGLHVIKKLLSLCTLPEYEKYQPQIIAQMAANCIELAQNPYGNYGLQIALDSYPQERCVPIIESIKGKVAHLSVTKYSSNVVERCFEKAGPKLCAQLIGELIQADNLISTSHPS